ncbi:PREDICTED: membrane progestin receptor gamma-B-like [Tauraco erythrolophus]|uniref:membrane progestin receptor gamma-B-like n=1 Tax=Tauraco erythrolophus TaxID=121530 RepID=UPI000523AC6D|nr:PREDICTED: membrane progestin receptor gamma-B-like [Tauraco erythrolophus]
MPVSGLFRMRTEYAQTSHAIPSRRASLGCNSGAVLATEERRVDRYVAEGAVGRVARFYRCAAESCTEAAIPVHYKHTVFAFLTCFIFASHLPERLAPGHFDYIGHSHQVFHVCGIVGTHFQLEAITMDMAGRHGRLLPVTTLLPSSLQTLGSMGIGAAGSLAVIALCSTALRFIPEPLQREKLHGH